ncbi:uncharacterized protein B0H18DRAFT_965764 [Fomitopsis serialis]|uniref:uncharacterized protein n=1 Tax=Fomitopsis serialis TaxID=139415 RepID=UPI0020088A3F|nr:uncharacterized protein B0H18DRAFT_965764 [Neoantrodia serialis]KAH9938137.1 hypothetical protein B0H18DRAFT_965764 [Neoantrodia serialis]
MADCRIGRGCAPMRSVAVAYDREPPVTSGSSSPKDTFATPLSSPTQRSMPLPAQPSSSNTSDKPLPPIQHSPTIAEEKPLPPILHESSVHEEKSLPDAGHASPRSDTLTPLRAHYLKKELISLEFQRELNALTAVPTNNISPFSYLGPPFTPPPKGAPSLELPFLCYCFRKFVISFPFLADAPRNFFPDKLQPFLASMLSRNLSSSGVLDEGDEDSEEAARHKLLAKLERHAAMLMTSGTKLQEKEEVVRLKQADLDRLEMIAKKRAAREGRIKDKFEINVVCVRTVTEKGRVRSRVHEEFIIRTRRPHQKDVFVSRRYGDFKTLANELRKAHPGEAIPAPPAKDRTIVNISTSVSTTSPPGFRAAPPGSPHHPHSFSSQGTMSPTSPISFASGQGYSGGASKLAREKNRLTLRAYLHSLLAVSELASSPVLRSFLLSGPTQLSPDELEDARRREEADELREDGRKRFAKEIAARVDGLRDAAKSVKGELFAKDGLTQIFATIKVTDDIRNLPENFQAVIELASTVFQHFVAADNASETFASLKRIHGLMPYFMLKTALKVSNPVVMIRGVLDLFLAQPFGGRSLLQRMFTGSLVEEVKGIEEDVEAVKDKVDDPILCEKIRQFVYAPREIQAVYKADAAAEDIHLLAAVLRSAEEPMLSRAQMQRVHYAHRAHKEYVKHVESLQDSDDDDGPQDEQAWLFEDLSVLARLYSRMRDREQLIEIIFEGSTADLLKDIITIFYAPLAQVYRAASISDSLGDLQNFINDLIRTVESTEELSQSDPAKTVQIYIDLVKRHEQAFYSFVHKVHSKGEGLFTDLMRWIELFITLMRDGLGERISMEFILPHTGSEREAIMREVDAIALYHYKLKVAYEDKVRKRFGRTQGMNDADAEDEVAAELVNSVVKDLSFGELIQGDADDLAAEETDSEEDDSSDEDEWSSDEDDSEETDSSDDSDGSEGGRTEREGTPHARQRERPPAVSPRSPDSQTASTSSQSPTSPVKRSRTLGHVPLPLPSRSKFKSKPSSQESSPRSSTDRPPANLRHSRSLILKQSGKKSPPPPVPRSAPVRPRSRSRTRPQSLPPKKKKEPTIQPPELFHLPQLLPIFMELVSLAAPAFTQLS